MAVALDPPEKGFVFWPVGNGDSTSVWIDADTVIQLDIHEVQAADAEDDPRESVIDQLAEILPVINGKPYLAAFGATHLDDDHVKGFAELNERVSIGDLWFTPRVLDEQDDEELSDDAKAFVEEAKRRVDALGSVPQAASGDRIRIIGGAEVISEAPYSELPPEVFTLAGEFFTEIDGVDRSDAFRAFVHAPEEVDAQTASNDTSLALQLTLVDGDTTASALLFGDLSYPTLSDIFARSDAENLVHEVFLAPHHCSRSVMYADDESGKDTLKQDILDEIAAAMNSGGYIVASCAPIPDSNQSGDNPPHADARNRYQETVDPQHFIATGEYPSEDDPVPVVFALAGDSFALLDERSGEPAGGELSDAVAAARGGASGAGQAAAFG